MLDFESLTEVDGIGFVEEGVDEVEPLIPPKAAIALFLASSTCFAIAEGSNPEFGFEAEGVVAFGLEGTEDVFEVVGALCPALAAANWASILALAAAIVAEASVAAALGLDACCC